MPRDERDPVEETPTADAALDSTADAAEGSTADAEGSRAYEPAEDDELEIDDPAALERATERVSDAELGDDDELVDEPTNAELATVTEPADDRSASDDQADVNGGKDRELVGVGAPTRGSTARAKGTKEGATKKGRATPKQDGRAAARKRTGPVTFVKESVGELRKVVYPTGPQLLSYFVVVLIFVLFVIAFVSVLDLAFGWAILKVFS